MMFFLLYAIIIMFVRTEQCTKNASDMHVCVCLCVAYSSLYYFSQTHMGRTQWLFSRRAADKRTTAGVQDRVRVLAG